MTAILLVAGLVLAPGAWAQEPPAPLPPRVNVAGRIFAVSQALDEVTAAAEAGSWQAADDAFNRSVDLMDAARLEIEPGIGGPAAGVFARAYGLLDTLDLALRSEDPMRVGATVGDIKLTLSELSGAALSGGAASQAAAVTAWQEQLRGILAQGEAGQWRPMRNASLDLYRAVVDQGPAVAEASADPSSVAQVRAYAARGFVAALDQDLEAGRRVVAQANAAALRLLVALGVARPTARAPGSAAAARAQFRAYLVEARPGDALSLPVVAENLPGSGLGAFEIELRWSAGALRLVDVDWEFGSGQSERDDAGGRLVLRQPQAPTGPSDRTILANLSFVLVGEGFDPEDYLPQGQAQAVRDAITASRTALRRGDVAAVGRAMEAVHGLLAPRPEPGMAATIGDAWAGLVPTDALLAGLVELMEQVSVPSLTSDPEPPSDVLLERLASVEEGFASTLQAYGAAIDGEPRPSVPVLVRVLRVTDTSGADIGPGIGVPGQVVVLGGDSVPTGPSTEAALPPSDETAAAPTEVVESPIGTAPATELPGAKGGGRGLAALLLVAVVFGLALGGAYLSQRSANGGRRDE